ncbi:hypothetical protein KVV02_002150 [Mortierella alpina]|uniref:Uncharacterized protein n=1 Tax=Mortierella alpina TaxID=64518 RepID=A0A9P8CW40_MORAP|nr:hypothetical protein KVV02_002150 [Mortierella alpina]
MPPPELVTTTITWPPSRETHIITAIINGTWTAIPAYQTANLTLFPNYIPYSTTTKPPPTTVIGARPPPPFASGSPTSTASSSGDGPLNAAQWRNWGLVILAVVVLAIIGGFTLRRYRKGRPKKQEPGNFVSVGEDDQEGTGGGGASPAPGASSISLATLGGHHHHHHHPSQVGGTESNVRERRNSQPIPRVLDMDRTMRS